MFSIDDGCLGDYVFAVFLVCPLSVAYITVKQLDETFKFITRLNLTAIAYFNLHVDNFIQGPIWVNCTYFFNL